MERYCYGPENHSIGNTIHTDAVYVVIGRDVELTDPFQHNRDGKTPLALLLSALVPCSYARGSICRAVRFPPPLFTSGSTQITFSRRCRILSSRGTGVLVNARQIDNLRTEYWVIIHRVISIPQRMLGGFSPSGPRPLHRVAKTASKSRPEITMPRRLRSKFCRSCNHQLWKGSNTNPMTCCCSPHA